jgi:protein TonB
VTRGGALLSWPLWTSLGIHVVGLASAASVVALARHEPERVLVPVEIVRVEPPLRTPPEKPPAPRQISRPSPAVRSTPTPQTLMPDPAPRTERAADPAAAAPERRYLASADAPGPVLPIPGPAGDGGLLLPSPEIPGVSSGAPSVGATVARGDGEGVTSFARPLGGYQTTPHYPEGARRQGVEGTVMLRFEVLASGKVGTVQVQRSAGRADLDRAAVEAIQTWRFEPARRGKEAVAVWVTLPVRFELNAR